MSGTRQVSEMLAQVRELSPHRGNTQTKGFWHFMDLRARWKKNETIQESESTVHPPIKLFHLMSFCLSVDEMPLVLFCLKLQNLLMTWVEDLLHWVLSQSGDVLKAAFSSNKRPLPMHLGKTSAQGPSRRPLIVVTWARNAGTCKSMSYEGELTPPLPPLQRLQRTFCAQNGVGGQFSATRPDKKSHCHCLWWSLKDGSQDLGLEPDCSSPSLVFSVPWWET